MQGPASLFGFKGDEMQTNHTESYKPPKRGRMLFCVLTESVEEPTLNSPLELLMGVEVCRPFLSMFCASRTRCIKPGCHPRTT